MTCQATCSTPINRGGWFCSLVPGEFVLPLGGEAEANLKDNGARRDDEIVRVLRRPHPSFASRRKIPLVAVKVQCMDGTKMYLRTPPYHRFAVVG